MIMNMVKPVNISGVESHAPNESTTANFYTPPLAKTNIYSIYVFRNPVMKTTTSIHVK